MFGWLFKKTPTIPRDVYSDVLRYGKASEHVEIRIYDKTTGELLVNEKFSETDMRLIEKRIASTREKLLQKFSTKEI